MGNRVGRVLLAVALAASLGVLVRPSATYGANGAANCAGESALGAGNFHPGSTTGIYAHLDPQPLQICLHANGLKRGSFSWSAIQAVQPCADCILQIGRGWCDDPLNLGHCHNQGQRVFTSWGRNPAVAGCAGFSEIDPVPKDRGPAPQDNGYHYYRVAIDGASYRFDHWPKGQALVLEWSLLVNAVCWRGSSEAVTFVERWNDGDALGGFDANHYQVLHITGRGGGAWTPVVLNPNDDCDSDPGGLFNPYNCDITGSQAWEAWTSR